MSTKTETDQKSTLDIVRQGLDDLKAVDVVEIDVKEVTSVTETMVVATGTSSRHVSAIAGRIAELAKENKTPPVGVEGEESSEWVLVDLGDVIVHVMQAKIRDFYQLESLWEVTPLQHLSSES
jgi:ribosome-associated protein